MGREWLKRDISKSFCVNCHLVKQQVALALTKMSNYILNLFLKAVSPKFCHSFFSNFPRR